MVKKKERDSKIELLRIICSFMVVMIHVAAEFWYSYPVESFEWKVMTFYDSLVRPCVPIFIMISGIYFIKKYDKDDLKDLYFKKILRIIIIYLIWSSVYLIYDIKVRLIHYELIDGINKLIFGPVQFYYLPITVILYMMSPYLVGITKNMTKEMGRYFLYVFLFFSFFNTFTDIPFIRGYSAIHILYYAIPSGMVLNFLSYFILGNIMYNQDIIKHKKILYGAGIISPFIVMFLTYYSSKFVGAYQMQFFGSSSIFTLFEVLALFTFVKESKLKNSEFINKVGGCTLGIYILHYLILEILKDNNIFYISNSSVIFMLPLITIIIWLICLVLTYILKLINKKII